MKARNAEKGFTLVEILIVVVILGILAAIVIPQFTSASESARASSLASQLQTVRSQLELYQVQHNGNKPDLTTNWDQFTATTTQGGASGAGFGPYMQQAPRNPFTGGTTVAATATADWQMTSGQFRAVVSTDDASDAQLQAAGLIIGSADGSDWGDVVRPAS